MLITVSDKIILTACVCDEHTVGTAPLFSNSGLANPSLNSPLCLNTSFKLPNFLCNSRGSTVRVFLGHIEGIRPDPKKTEAIMEMKEPENVGELRNVLGMVNQLGRFIPQLAEKDKPLRDLLSRKTAGSGAWTRLRRSPRWRGL